MKPGPEVGYPEPGGGWRRWSPRGGDGKAEGVRELKAGEQRRGAAGRDRLLQQPYGREVLGGSPGEQHCEIRARKKFAAMS